jgi:hypothetical protein
LSAEPYDENDISPDQTIIRRINPVQHIVRDDNRGCNRVSSKAFSPSSGKNGGMSVDIETKIVEAELDPQKYVTTPIFTGSVSFLASAARALGLWIGYEPIPETPYHGEVWGTPKPNRFRKSQKNRLHGACDWYVPLEGVEIK